MTVDAIDNRRRLVQPFARRKKLRYLVLRAQEQEPQLNAAFSAGEPTACRGLLFRRLEHALQVSDFDPPVASAARASAKGGGHDDDAIANT